MRHFTIQRNSKDIGWEIMEGSRKVYFNDFAFEQDARSFCAQIAERQGVGHSITVDCRSPANRAAA